MKRAVLCSFILCFGPLELLRALSPGTTGADFLKIPVGPRSIAMGEAGTASADGISAIWWNPGALSGLEAPEATFMYNQWLSDITEQFSAVAYPTKRWGTLGLSFYRLGSPSFQGYDANANPTSSEDAADMSLGISYARGIQCGESGRLGLGLTTKGIEEDLAGVQAQTYALDLGAKYEVDSGLPAWIERIAVGLSAQNLGPELTFDQESAPLPRAYRAGMSFTGESLSDYYTLALDGIKPVDGRFYAGFGGEYWLRKLLALRAGYQTQQDIGQGIRAGVGFKIHGIQLDYAWASFGDLGNTSRISLTLRFSHLKNEEVRFSSLAEEHYAKGLKLYKEGAYGRAIVEFNKTLERMPNHEDAKEMIKACQKKLDERY